MVNRYASSNKKSVQFSDQDFCHLFQLILPNFPASIYVKDTELRYFWCNKYQLNMAGFTKLSDIQGKTDDELPWRDQAAQLAYTDKQVLRSKEAVVTEERAYLSDGREAIFLTKKVPWFSDVGSQSPTGIVGISVEITQYKKSIEDAKAQLKNIISNIPGSLYLKNKKLVYLDCNDFVLRMAGLKNKSQIIGKTDYDLPWRNQAEAIINNDREVIEKGVTQEFEETPTLADGTKITMVTRKTPLRDLNGNIIGVLGISLDISTRKKMECALRQAKAKADEFNKLKSQFIENMQHDLRSPASGVMQALSYLHDVEKDTEKLEVVKVGLGSSEALMSLLNEVVESSQKDYSNPVLDRPMKIEMIFESVYRLHAAGARMKHLKFHYHIDENIPQVMISDKYRLERILLNLVGNAVKFTEKGEVFFEASV